MISSLRNPAIRTIRQLSRTRDRTATGRFVVEGIRPVLAAIAAGIEIDTLVIAPTMLRSSVAWTAITRARAQDHQLLEVSDEVFGSLSSRDRPTGILLVGIQHWTALQDLPRPRNLGWVALLEPQDPGNLGTVIRVADAVGVDAVFTLGAGSVDPYHPGALRAAMGSTFSLPMVKAGFAEFVALIRKLDLPLIGTSDDATQDYRTFAYGCPIALLMGRERAGTHEVEQAATMQMVQIPMVGSADSLNLAVATSIVLYEIFNQHRLKR